ncbi:hypothetical protein [Desulfatiferula olefinivorans]
MNIHNAVEKNPNINIGFGQGDKRTCQCFVTDLCDEFAGGVHIEFKGTAGVEIKPADFRSGGQNKIGMSGDAP